MKIKPIYLYLILFTSFIVGIILFTNKSNSSSDFGSMQNMPDDDVHLNMGKEGEMPSSANVMEDARKRLEELRLNYEKNPDDTLRTREYADLLRLAHQPDKAIELYEKIIKKDPKRIDILLELTFLYFNKGELDKAELFTNNILQIDKNHQLGTYNLGSIAAAKGDKVRAKSIWQGLIDKYPNTDIAFLAQQSILELEKINR